MSDLSKKRHILTTHDSRTNAQSRPRKHYTHIQETAHQIKNHPHNNPGFTNEFTRPRYRIGAMPSGGAPTDSKKKNTEAQATPLSQYIEQGLHNTDQLLQ